ncbi:hypothetical protein SAMN04489732_102478 [Amycolatopsis saalfeldensis]|uniref:Uncharacterized protein n=1 Tax=Amycolatopsis saalfeldensis TaxID=394193 RepID=A0A1H8T9J4_9PSEU|nr:hypothetical protein SAMN04489732_102478 [Amycolatopsis saalfeldensis]
MIRARSATGRIDGGETHGRLPPVPLLCFFTDPARPYFSLSLVAAGKPSGCGQRLAEYECAPVPASLPPSTIRYSSRIGVPSNQDSRISRVPAE